MVFAFFKLNIHTLLKLTAIFELFEVVLIKMKQQNKFQGSFLLLFFMILLGSSCKKDRVTFPWTEMKLETERPLSDIQFINSEEGYISTGLDWIQGEIFATTDGGLNWEIVLEDEVRFSGLDVDFEGNIYSIGYVGRFVKKEDGVITNTQLSVYDPFDDIATWDGTTTFIVSGGIYSNGTISKLDYWGNVLSRDTFVNAFEGVDFIDETHAIASGYGQLYRTDDLGENWYQLAVTGDYYKDVHFPSSQVGYICGYGGNILKSTDGGYQWDYLRNGDRLLVSNKRFNALHFEDETHGYIVGNNGLCWRTIDGGKHWQVIKKLPKYDFLAVQVVGDKAYLVSQEGWLVVIEHG